MNNNDDKTLLPEIQKLGESLSEVGDGIAKLQETVASIPDAESAEAEKMPETLLECFTFEAGTKDELDTIEFLQSMLKFIRKNNDMFMSLFLASGFDYDEETKQPLIAVGHPYLAIAQSATFLSVISSEKGQALRAALEKKVVRSLADAHDELRRRHFILSKELNADGE